MIDASYFQGNGAPQTDIPLSSAILGLGDETGRGLQAVPLLGDVDPYPESSAGDNASFENIVLSPNDMPTNPCVDSV